MVIRKAWTDQNLAHKCLKSQVVAPRTENNKEMVIMDKLLVPPLTLHQTIYLHFQVPLGLALPALPYITDLHTASNSHRPVWTASCPLMTAPNEHLHAFWQSASQAWKGFMVNKTTPFYYQLSNPSLQALFCSSDYRNTWLWLGSLWPRAGGGSTWAELWSEKRCGFGKQQKMVIISSFSVSTTISPKGRNLHSGVAHTNTS